MLDKFFETLALCEDKVTYGEDGRRIKGWETRLTYGARLLSVALFTGGCRTVHIGFSRGAFWMTELLMRESVAVAGAIFLGGYPFPESANISKQEALDLYTGKMPQLTQERFYIYIYIIYIYIYIFIYVYSFFPRRNSKKRAEIKLH